MLHIGTRAKNRWKIPCLLYKTIGLTKKQLEHASFLLSHQTWCTGPYLICCCWAMVLEFGECRGRAGGESLRDTEQGKSRNNLKVIYIEEGPALQIQGYIWLSTHCISSQVKIRVSYAPTSKHNPNIQIKASTHPSAACNLRWIQLLVSGVLIANMHSYNHK